MVTFSHADEVKQAIISTGGKMKIGSNIVELMPMGDEDHSTLDYNYYSKQMTEDGKVADLSQELRDSQKALRDFEADIDNQIP